ncbi:MAG: YdcF family protein [Deltaproteobacteria bacterium]
MDKKQKIWVVLFVIIAGLTYFVHNAGYYLVREDKLVSADVIVVLMGGGPERILEAVDLYKAGYGNRILMVENDQPGYKLLKSRKVSIPREADLNKSIGMQLGVPSNAFIILPGDAQSTQEEATHIKKYLKAHPELGSIILVSSRYHTYRSAKIFERILNRDSGKKISIIARPSRYSAFNEKAWWKSQEDAEQVVYEYVKLVAFYTIDR